MRIGQQFAWCGKHALFCVLAVVSAGCVAINAGKPETFIHKDTVTEMAPSPSSWTVTGARGQAQQTDNKLVAGMSAEVQEGYARIQFEETVVVKKQKRLAIGLFPGAAERFLMPDGALDSGEGYFRDGHVNSPRYYSLYSTEMPYLAEHLVSILIVGLPYAFGTINSMLVEPFSGWSCSSHDYLDKANLKPNGMNPYKQSPFLDCSESPKIQALARFTADERKKIGVKTCFDGTSTDGNMSPFTHMGLVGCHKYLAVFVEPVKRGPGQAVEEKVKLRRADVEGPYVAELSIPALGWSRRARVERGATRAEFALPAAERKCVAEAVVRFRADGAGAASEVTRGALEKVAGQEYRFDVTLQGGAGTVRKAETAMRTETVPPPAGKTPGQAYEVVGIKRAANGRYEVRVRIADKSKTFDIGWAVEPDVKRMIREDFVKRHPGAGIQYVREMVEWETEEDGSILVYRGWAFSARPEAMGSYDDESRRGMVRLRISEGMPAEEAKRWARENIEAIVKEKNVVLEAGVEPPSGAMYRSLSESLEDGVLTVEFEAVE